MHARRIMADIREWAKGITFFLVASFLFYFFWDNIFINIIGFLGTDMFGIGADATTSLAILKAMGWVSFIFMWLITVPFFLVYSIIVGSRNEVKTQPLELLKGIGVWAVLMPFLSFIYGLIHWLIYVMNASNILDSGMETTATQLSWVMAIIVLLFTVLVPFYFFLKGYGVDIGDKKESG